MVEKKVGRIIESMESFFDSDSQNYPRVDTISNAPRPSQHTSDTMTFRFVNCTYPIPALTLSLTPDVSPSLCYVDGTYPPMWQFGTRENIKIVLPPIVVNPSAGRRRIRFQYTVQDDLRYSSILLGQ